MNWIVFLLASWLAVGADMGLAPALELGDSAIAPSLALVLLALVVLWAPQTTVYAAALVIGALLDLTRPPVGEAAATSAAVLGPMALGCLAGAYAGVTCRGLLIRQNPLALAFIALIVAAIASIVGLTIMTIRASYDPAIHIEPARELGVRLGSAVYTAVAALLLSPLLRLASPVFAFPLEAHKRARIRR